MRQIQSGRWQPCGGKVCRQPFGCQTTRGKKGFQRVSSVVLFACGLFLTGCANDQQAKKLESPPTQTAVVVQPQQSPTPQLSTLPPPKLIEVQNAVERVFKGSALVDTSRTSSFIVGDFNGDLSQDLAVVLKPAPEKLSELNEDSPPWILKDPFLITRPGVRPLRVTENEPLLAVIHGYGSEGWRDPQASQTYLLKNAVGPGVETRAKTEFINANRGRKLPRLRGDLIAELLRGASGYLYYDEAAYSWYDPKTFKGEPVRRLVHPGMANAK